MPTHFFQAFRHLSIQRKLTVIITLTSGLSLLLACAGFVMNDVLTFRSVTRNHGDAGDRRGEQFRRGADVR